MYFPKFVWLISNWRNLSFSILVLEEIYAYAHTYIHSFSCANSNNVNMWSYASCLGKPQKKTLNTPPCTVIKKITFLSGFPKHIGWKGMCIKGATITSLVSISLKHDFIIESFNKIINLIMSFWRNCLPAK